MIKKKPIFGALPSKTCPKELPYKKKFQKTIKKSIVNEYPYIPSSQTYIYHRFIEFCDQVSKLKTPDDCNVTLLFNRILIQFFTKPITLPQFEIIVDDSLGFTVSLYGWFLPETHPLDYNYRRSIRNVNIMELVTKRKSYFICKGVSCAYNRNNKIIRHSVPTLQDPLFNEAPTQSTSFINVT